MEMSRLYRKSNFSSLFSMVYSEKSRLKNSFVSLAHQSIALKIDKELLKFRGQSSLFSQVIPCTLIKIS